MLLPSGADVGAGALSLLLMPKKLLKSLAAGLSLGVAAFSPRCCSLENKSCWAGGLVPMGARCGSESGSSASLSSSSIISAGGPDALYCTLGLLEGCLEPAHRVWLLLGAFQPGPNDSGLLLAPAEPSVEGQPSTPHRELSNDGLGSSFECVLPGRGLPGLRPKPEVKEAGHPPPSLSRLKRLRMANALLLGATF